MPAVLQMLTLFRTKKCHFHVRFQTWPLKSTPILRSGLWEIISSLLRLEQPQKRFLKIHFELEYFSLFITHLDYETINTFVHSCSSFENHTQFQTKMSKVYSLPRTQTSLFRWKCTRKGRREEENVRTLPKVPCGSSPVTRVSRSPLTWEKRSVWGGGWYIPVFRPKRRKTPTLWGGTHEGLGETSNFTFHPKFHWQGFGLQYLES